MHVQRKNNLLQRQFFSSKMHAVAAWCMAFTTPIWETFEHTPLFGACMTETAMVALWGFLGEAKTPIELWQNWCTQNKTRFDFCLETSLDKIDFSPLLDDKDWSQLELEIVALSADYVLTRWSSLDIKENFDEKNELYFKGY